MARRKKVHIDPEAQTFKRTESNRQYIYGSKVASKFAWWARVQRDYKRDDTFEEFYNQLPGEDQAMVKVKEI